MMLRNVVIVALIWIGLTLPAWADLDHLCLNKCVSQGASTSVCMKQCSYTGQSQTPALNSSPVTTSTHNVLPTLTPLKDKVVLLKPKKPAPILADKDYTCLNQCLHDGRPYGACALSCTKPTCSAGGVLCAIPSP